MKSIEKEYEHWDNNSNFIWTDVICNTDQTLFITAIFNTYNTTVQLQ